MNQFVFVVAISIILVFCISPLFGKIRVVEQNLDTTVVLVKALSSLVLPVMLYTSEVALPSFFHLVGQSRATSLSVQCLVTCGVEELLWVCPASTTVRNVYEYYSCFK